MPLRGTSGTGEGATAFVELEDAPEAYTDQAGKLLAVNAEADGLEFVAAPAGGDSELYAPVLQFPASALATPATAGAPLSRNDDLPCRLFDDSTPERVMGSFVLPANFDATGTVIVTAVVQPATDATADVCYQLDHMAIATGEPQGTTWATTDAAAAFGVTDDGETADTVFAHVIELSAATLGWAAGDVILFRFVRDADNAADTLTGDLRLYHLTIKIPTAA